MAGASSMNAAYLTEIMSAGHSTPAPAPVPSGLPRLGRDGGRDIELEDWEEWGWAAS